MKAIVTIPPYASYLKKVAEHPVVEGFRLNTVMPLKESLEGTLSRLRDTANGKPVWIDLKCRQIRVSRGEYYDAPKNPVVIEVEGQKVVLDPSNPKSSGQLRTPPWSVIEIDHEISLDTSKPVKCYFNDGYQSAYIVRVDGNKLIMLDGPQRVVGGGESINILHPSLEIKGYFTPRDLEYIAAAKKVGMHDYMLSYVERSSDLADLFEQDHLAKPVAKIESRKGLEFVAQEYSHWKDKVRLMTARGDLYVEVGKPHQILSAIRSVVDADPHAIAASRILGSLKQGYVPECSDITDIGFLREVGYRRVMIGDDICFKEEPLFSALNIIQAVNLDYQPKRTFWESMFKRTKKYDGGG
jgi:pyruvate kinase